VHLLAVDEAAGMAWVIEIDSGFAFYVAATPNLAGNPHAEPAAVTHQLRP
jgi:hypothetical protein